MKILALDFSSSQRSVAVVSPPGGPAPVLQSEIVEAGGRSTQAFSLIERALAEVRLEREAIECIVVGLGPGSYTGIRAAIAIAQGWQLARDVRVCGIRTVDVLAAQAQADGLRGAVHIVVDAQRGEFYCATWELSAGRWVETGLLRLVSRGDIESLLAAGAEVRGPDLKQAFPSVRELFPSALALGRLALHGGDYVAGERLEPVYLRETAFVKAPPPRESNEH
jgi:tRNA threonylcarbamoyl adenosine modification protein YeaZ